MKYGKNWLKKKIRASERRQKRLVKTIDEILGLDEQGRSDLAFLVRADEAKAFYRRLVDKAVVIFDNNDRMNGLAELYTAGRDSAGCLNGHITASDIKLMQRMGEQKCDMYFDTLVLPVAIWAELLRQPAFGEILHGSLTIVPTEQMPVDTTNDTSSVLLLNSRDLQQVVVARSVKLS